MFAKLHHRRITVCGFLLIFRTPSSVASFRGGVILLSTEATYNRNCKTRLFGLLTYHTVKLVRVVGFEPTVSWTRTMRDAKFHHTLMSINSEILVLGFVY